MNETSMNKSIHQLAKQAGMVMYPTGLGVKENTLWGDRNIEKFAQLIVRECGIVADQWVNDEDNGRNLVSAKLKQHFGVEE